MSKLRTSIVAGALSMMALSPVVHAQTTTAPAPAKPAATTPAPTKSASEVATDVQKWSKKQWAAARTEFAKDKDKWAACRKQSTDQKLTGRKSWAFLYECMKK